jgi:large subunit ribosomal protein L10
MSEVRKTSKADTVESMRNAIASQKGAVVAAHHGLTVAEVTSLRKKLREANADFRVVKNTLIRLAAKGTDFSKLDDVFTGPTAVGFAKGDPVALAKAMKEFAGGNPKVKLKAGFLDGKVLSAREVESLAETPSRQVLLARLAGGLAAPIARQAQALSGPERKLVYALNSIHDQKSKQTAA